MVEVGTVAKQARQVAQAERHGHTAPDVDPSSVVKAVEKVEATKESHETAVSQVRTPPTRDSVERMAEEIRERLQTAAMELSIRVDEDELILELVDPESGKVIRRIPPDWFRSHRGLADPLDAEGAKLPGVLVDRSG